MPDQPEMPNSERYHCLISSCSWHFDMPPAPIVDRDVLAHVFGPDVMAIEARNQHSRRIERELETHLNTHSILEFATEISRLTSLVVGLAAQFAEVNLHYGRAVAAGYEG